MKLLHLLGKNDKKLNISQDAGQTCQLSDKVLTNKKLLVNVFGSRGGGVYPPRKNNFRS